MANTTLARRQNALALFQACAEQVLAGGAAPKGLEQAISPSMWSQIKPSRPIGDKLARQIESHCGRPSRHASIWAELGGTLRPMFSHLFVGITDFDRALSFYEPLMHELGIAARFKDDSRPWAGWHSEGGTRPLFVIARPFDGGPPAPGNGQMVAFLARDRHTVRRAYALALVHGGSGEGPPGLRPEYHPNYYGAYFRDPDGNKLCVACHEAES